MVQQLFGKVGIFLEGGKVAVERGKKGEGDLFQFGRRIVKKGGEIEEGRGAGPHPFSLLFHLLFLLFCLFFDERGRSFRLCRLRRRGPRFSGEELVIQEFCLFISKGAHLLHVEAIPLALDARCLTLF